jgi:hypothetical protein
MKSVPNDLISLRIWEMSKQQYQVVLKTQTPKSEKQISENLSKQLGIP